jgi:hypothetical protein
MLGNIVSYYYSTIIGHIHEPDVGMNLLTIQIDVMTLVRQHLKTIVVEIKVDHVKGRAHDEEFAISPIGLVLDEMVGILGITAAMTVSLELANADRCVAFLPFPVVKFRRMPNTCGSV